MNERLNQASGFDSRRGRPWCYARTCGCVAAGSPRLRSIRGHHL